MPVLATHQQLTNLREVSTRPITLIRWEHSGFLETLSLSGEVEFNSEIFLPGHIDPASLKIKNNESASFWLPVTSQRLAESKYGAWRGGKICQIWEVPGRIDDDEIFVYDLEQGILKLDGVIDSSKSQNGKIYVEILHKYLSGNYTPRYTCNDFFSSIPTAGSIIKAGTDKYMLKSRRARKQARLKSRGLRGRLSTQEINSFIADDKNLETEMTADGAFLPVPYGKNSIPGLLVAKGVDGSGNHVYVVTWTIGLVFQIDDIFGNEAALPSTAIVHTYRGLKCQGVDNYAASMTGVTWTDTGKLVTPNGTACACYSVIVLPAATTEVSRFHAIQRGRLVYDPRQGGTDYFDNMSMNKVGHNLQFTGTNGTTPTGAGAIDKSHVGAAVTWFGNANIQSNKLALDGDGDYIRVPRTNADTRFSTGVWSWELQVTPSVGGETNHICGIGDNSSDMCIWLTQAATALWVSMSSNGTSWDIALVRNIYNTAFSAGATTNILIEFDGRGYFFYINGTERDYIATTAKLRSTTADLYLGAHSTSAATSMFKGTITGSRFDQGVIRYGGQHTVPAGACYADQEDNIPYYGYTDVVGNVVADLIYNPFYGFGATESILYLLNFIKYNESSSPQQTISLVLSESKPTQDWLDLIVGTYGGGFWFTQSDTIALRPDRLADKFNPSGEEITTNGDFFNDASDWTLGSGWSHIGTTDGLSGGAANSAVTQTLGRPTIAGATYVATLSLDFIFAGTLRVDLDGLPIIEAQGSAGVYAYEFVATGAETTLSMVVGATGIAALVGELSLRRKFWRDDTIRAGTLKITPQSNADIPNRLIATYRKSSNSTPIWGDELPIIVQMPGVGVDGSRVVETRVRFEGLKGFNKAYARAEEKLYRIQSKDAVEWITTDAALLYQRGMVIELYDAEHDQIIYTLLEDHDRIEPGRYQCRGLQYSDMQYPAQQTIHTGQIPVDMIFPALGSSVPAGWQAWTTANGRAIKCAGESVALGGTGGASTYAGISGSTTSDGAHGDEGEDPFPAKAFTGTGGSGSGRLYSDTDEEAALHSHTVSTGVVTPDVFRREMVLLQKITSPGTDLPPEVMTFGKSNVFNKNNIRYVKFARRVMFAAVAAANAGVLQKILPLTTGSADDSHDHWTWTDITNGTPGGTAVTDPHYAPVTAGGPHTHALNAELVRSLLVYKLCLYASGQNRGLGPNVIGFWPNSLDTLPADWTLCDERLNTPGLEGKYLEVAMYGEEDQVRGSNSLKLRCNSAWSAKHEHEGSVDNTDVAAVVDLSHRKGVRHRHAVRIPDEPVVYTSHHFWEPLFRTLYPVMYNPSPVPNQKDVNLLLEGDMPNGHATVVDASMYSRVATLGGGGSISYSSTQTLFGLNTLRTTGGRYATYSSIPIGKKFTIQGLFCNDAAGAVTYLFSNNSAANTARSFTVAKDASNNIVLYLPTAVVATVTLGLAANEWYYVELNYNGVGFSLYAGKTSVGTAARAYYASAAFDPMPQLRVFDVHDSFLVGIFPFVGYAAQIRLTTGAARNSASLIKIPTGPFDNEHSAHYIAGHQNWFNPCGRLSGHYTNLAPDNDQAALLYNPGGRAYLWRETGAANVVLEVQWAGIHSEEGGLYYGEGGIVACVNLASTAYGIGFNYESGLGAWVLWGAVGREPNNIGNVLDLEVEAHTSGTPVTLQVTISGTAITCKADGVTKCTGTVPAALVGSTKHGVYVDVNRVPGRPKNLPCLVAPFTVVKS